MSYYRDRYRRNPEVIAYHRSPKKLKSIRLNDTHSGYGAFFSSKPHQFPGKYVYQVKLDLTNGLSYAEEPPADIARDISDEIGINISGLTVGDLVRPTAEESDAPGAHEPGLLRQYMSKETIAEFFLRRGINYFWDDTSGVTADMQYMVFDPESISIIKRRNTFQHPELNRGVWRPRRLRRRNPAKCPECGDMGNDSDIGGKCFWCNYRKELPAPILMEQYDFTPLPMYEVPEACDCAVCRSMCKRPCWPTLQDAERLLDLGYGDRLMIDYWGADESLDHTELLVPAFHGLEKDYAPTSMVMLDRYEREAGCNFLTDEGLCEIHSICKPTEGRLASCKGTPKELHLQVVQTWDSPEGKALVERWKKEYVEGPDRRNPKRLVRGKWRGHPVNPARVARIEGVLEELIRNDDKISRYVGAVFVGDYAKAMGCKNSDAEMQLKKMGLSSVMISYPPGTNREREQWNARRWAHLDPYRNYPNRGLIHQNEDRENPGPYRRNASYLSLPSGCPDCGGRKNPLKITDHMKQRRKDEKHSIVVMMRPEDFSRLTHYPEKYALKYGMEIPSIAIRQGPEAYKDFLEHHTSDPVRPLEEYNKWSELHKNTMGPVYLKIEPTDDPRVYKVVGHEGRHRVVSMWLEGEPLVEVSVKILGPLARSASIVPYRSGYRNTNIYDLPPIIEGEFDPHWRFDTRDIAHVLETNIQESFQRRGRGSIPKKFIENREMDQEELIDLLGWLPAPEDEEDEDKGIERFKSLDRHNPEDYTGSHEAPGEEGAPLHNLLEGGTFPSDVYTHMRYYQFHDAALESQAERTIRHFRGKPDGKVRIYRAVPEHVNKINTGDWVTIVKDYAIEHSEGEDFKIIAARVPARMVYTNGDSLMEWGYVGPNRWIHPK